MVTGDMNRCWGFKGRELSYLILNQGFPNRRSLFSFNPYAFSDENYDCSYNPCFRNNILKKVIDVLDDHGLRAITIFLAPIYNCLDL